MLCPVNQSPDIKASYSLLSQVTYPLVESGYYVPAVVTQIANTLPDKGHEIAGITSTRLFSAGQPNGILYGPRSPHYGAGE